MQLTSTTATTSAASTSATATKKTDLVSTDAFMQLLVAQLKNQDPTKPVDSTQYVSQLASLSGLEQSVKQTSALDRLATQIGSASASAVLGLYAASADGSKAGLVHAARYEANSVTMTLDSGKELSLDSGVSLFKP